MRSGPYIGTSHAFQLYKRHVGDSKAEKMLLMAEGNCRIALRLGERLLCPCNIRCMRFMRPKLCMFDIAQVQCVDSNWVSHVTNGQSKDVSCWFLFSHT